MGNALEELAQAAERRTVQKTTSTLNYAKPVRAETTNTVLTFKDGFKFGLGFFAAAIIFAILIQIGIAILATSCIAALSPKNSPTSPSIPPLRMR